MKTQAYFIPSNHIVPAGMPFAIFYVLRGRNTKVNCFFGGSTMTDDCSTDTYGSSSGIDDMPSVIAGNSSAMVRSSSGISGRSSVMDERSSGKFYYSFTADALSSTTYEPSSGTNANLKSTLFNQIALQSAGFLLSSNQNGCTSLLKK